MSTQSWETVLRSRLLTAFTTTSVASSIFRLEMAMFRRRLCSSSVTFSGTCSGAHTLKRLLLLMSSPLSGKAPWTPNLNCSSKRPGEMRTLYNLSSSNSLNTVPRTWLGFRAIQLRVGSLYFVWNLRLIVIA
ncbi:unnamed protein product, partial [Ixodes pacificus]